MPLVTIDPPDAKDHDDAVHAAPDPDPDNAGRPSRQRRHRRRRPLCAAGFGARPRRRLERGNSVYFPDRVVPMLPERISNDLCSLRPHEDRPALAVRMVIGADGRKRSHTFHRVMMRSAAKLNYEQAQAAIDGRPDETTAPLLEKVLRAALRRLCGGETRARRARAARSRPARAQDRAQSRRRGRPRDHAAAIGGASADRGIHDPRQCRRRRNAGGEPAKPLIYRAHDEPSREKLSALSEFLATIGVKFAKGQTVRAGQFQRHPRAGQRAGSGKSGQ